MTVDAAVRERAKAFADGDCSLVGLHDWLASRAELIADELEGELWGLVVAVDGGELTVDQARQAVREQLAPMSATLGSDEHSSTNHAWRMLNEFRDSTMRASYSVVREPALTFA